MMPMQADPSMQQGMTPDLTKAADVAMQGLGRMLKELHVAQPDSPMTDAVSSIMKAVAEVVRSAGAPAPTDPSMGGPMQGDPMAGQMPPEGEGEMDPSMMGGMPPEPPMEEAPPASIGDAASQTHDMMLNAAKRRQA